VTSSSESLRKRVEAVLDMAVSTVSSLAETFSSGAPVAIYDENVEKSTSPEITGEHEHEESTLAASHTKSPPAAIESAATAEAVAA
jgi:cleavage and polyadenylation specificity factor subunit 3